ncbi:hypothetical protein GDO78_016923 [Eleutherodactylus coqui]|uniref:Uncharacterized protein n=1 Tax=Eleutherodactylus coqui TaxID=57060 RepID=A0A8J6E3L4_ELECQ|nr:hypothetical protein GDO78_016923 [Eleutherodactylus coqui]
MGKVNQQSHDRAGLSSGIIRVSSQDTPCVNRTPSCVHRVNTKTAATKTRTFHNGAKLCSTSPPSHLGPSHIYHWDSMFLLCYGSR